MWWIDPWLRIISVASPLKQEFPRLSMQNENGKLLNNHFSCSSWGNFILPIQICNTCSAEKQGLKVITVHLCLSYGDLKVQKFYTEFLSMFSREELFLFGVGFGFPKISTWLSTVHNPHTQVYLEYSWHSVIAMSKGISYMFQEGKYICAHWWLFGRISGAWNKPSLYKL